MAKRWIKEFGAGAPGVAGPPGASGSAGTPAPNITSATGAPAYALNGNDSVFGFSGVITLPTGSPDYTHLQNGGIGVFAYAPSDTKGTQIAWIPGSMFSGSTIAYSGGQFTQALTTSAGWKLTFVCVNEVGSPTASPVALTGISVQASAVSSVSASEASSGSWTVDPVTRQVHTKINFTPVLIGGQVPQVVTRWVSRDGGSNWVQSSFDTMTTVGQTFSLDEIKPATAQTWKVACATGVYGGDPAVLIPTASLPAAAVSSAGFSVSALSLPAANLITVLTVAAGAGGSFPYNALRPDDGSQYFGIPSIAYSDSSAASDRNAWIVVVTAQDLDASHATIGPESPFIRQQISGQGFTSGPLLGDYGTQGFGYTRTGNVAYARLRVYICNRVDQTNASFSNVLASTLQNTGGLSSGFVDVLVATGGALPAGKITLNRADPAQLGPNVAVNDAGLFDAVNSVGGNMLSNPGGEQGTQGWTLQLFSGATITTTTSQNHTALGTRAFTFGAVLSSGGVNLLQKFPATPGDIYKFSGWVKGDAGNNTQVVLVAQFIDATGGILRTDSVIGIGASPSTWTAMSGLTGAAPASTVLVYAYVVMSFLGAGSGNVYVDDLELLRLPATGAGTTIDTTGAVAAKLAALGGLAFNGSNEQIAKLGYTMRTDGSGNIVLANLPAVFGLPSLPSATYPAGAVILNTADNKVYRNPGGSAWVKSSDPADLVAGAVATGVTIAAAAITAGTFIAGVAYVGAIAAGQITAGTISAAISLTAPTIIVTGGSFTINIDSTNGVKLTGGGTTTLLQQLSAYGFVNGFVCHTTAGGGSAVLIAPGTLNFVSNISSGANQMLLSGGGGSGGFIHIFDGSGSTAAALSATSGLQLFAGNASVSAGSVSASGGFIANGSSGLTTTKTVFDGASTHTVTITGGLITAWV